MPLYRTGQSVIYKPVGGRESHTSQSIGTVKSVLTEPGVQAHRNVYASEDDPRYEFWLVPGNTPQGYKNGRFYIERYATERQHYVVMLKGALQPSSSTPEPAKLRVTKRNKNEVDTVTRPFSSKSASCEKRVPVLFNENNPQ
ncbi:hypothetical protein MAP00_000459 [Monascus purpureus]|nr:hypothetical protein MAP00_000459 [Monascus purpureus]